MKKFSWKRTFRQLPRETCHQWRLQLTGRLIRPLIKTKQNYISHLRPLPQRFRSCSQAIGHCVDGRRPSQYSIIALGINTSPPVLPSGRDCRFEHRFLSQRFIDFRLTKVNPTGVSLNLSNFMMIRKAINGTITAT